MCSASFPSKRTKRVIHYPCCMYLILGALSLVHFVSTQDCGQGEIDKCAEPMGRLHLTSEFSIGPTKKEELDKLCQDLRSGQRCIQSFTRRCMDRHQRNQFNKLYHGTNQFIRDLCTEGDFQDEYLRHAPCQEMATKEFAVCTMRYKETMDFLKPHHQETATLNESIKRICCSINALVGCSEEASRKVCGNNAAKFTRQLVDKYANSLTKIYCDEFSRQPELCTNGENKSYGLFQHSAILSLFISILLIFLQHSQ